MSQHLTFVKPKNPIYFSTATSKYWNSYCLS